MDILKSLDKETIKSYRTNVANEKHFSSNESYIKVTIDENNEMHMEESSLSEYLMESQLMKSDTGVSINSSTNTNRGWINIFTSVFERTATTGRATASFTWLTPPSPRMRAVVGIGLRNGVVISNTTSGYYYHTSPDKTYKYTFNASDIGESGGGTTANYRLTTSNYLSEARDFTFIQVNFMKEGNSEGATANYAHQKIQISWTPTFAISRDGMFSLSGGISFLTYYKQTLGGYASISWE